MHIIIIFLDGIGLGDNDPITNPFAALQAPTLHALSGGRQWLHDTPRMHSERALFLPTDATLGIDGRPQSATGQAAIVTGHNVAAAIGEHYGPKPTQPIRAIIGESSIFRTLHRHGKQVALINPYPPQFFAALDRGKRLPTSIQAAVMAAGVPLLTEKHYYRGEAVSPDWTGEGWVKHLGYTDAPTYSPEAAGALLARLGRQHHLTFFSTWITDEIGHRGPFERAIAFMECFDRVMAGLLENWNDEDGLVIITSDHGNMERQGDRRHTRNPVPTIVIGRERYRFAEGFHSLTDITPGILRVMGI